LSGNSAAFYDINLMNVDFSTIKTVHFIGIGGIGTSAIALQRRTGAMFLLRGILCAMMAT